MNPVLMPAVPPAAVTPPKPGAARGAPRDEADTFSPALMLLLAPAATAILVKATPVAIDGEPVPMAAVPADAGDHAPDAGADPLVALDALSHGLGNAARGVAHAATRGAKAAVPPGLANAAALAHAKTAAPFAAPVRAQVPGVPPADALPVDAPAPDTLPAPSPALASGIDAGDAPVTPAPLPVVETIAANLPQAPKPGAARTPAAAEPATGDAVVETVRRAVGVTAAANARQGGAGGEPKQDTGRNAAGVVRATRTDAAKPRGVAPAAPAVDAAAEARTATADAAPRTAAPAHAAATDASVTATGAPHDPRLASVDATEPRSGRSDQVTLRIDGDSGAEARVRVAVRGQDVRATIVADDPVLARRLEDGLSGLKQALGDRGFERAQVVVQSTTGSRHDAANDGSRDTRNPQRDAQRDTAADERKDGRPDGDAPSRRRPGRDRERTGR